MKRLVVALWLIPSSAFGQSPEQVNVISKIGEITALQDACSEVEADTGKIAIAMAAHGLAPEDIQDGGRFQGIMLENYAAMRTKLREVDPQSACFFATLLYGENGQVVAGMMRPKGSN